ncbi:hypothetical protein HY947_06615 [Candidatus Gottesmanbacteria bacterium]|nr:hypothetical protein [Candidatus Gottesmanbacteria bacterium]
MTVYAVDIEQIFTPAKSFPTIGSMVNVLLKNSLVIAGIIALALLIFGGFGVIVSAGEGDTKKLEQSQQTITGAVTGLIIIVAAVWIIQIIEKLTGLKLLSN